MVFIISVEHASSTGPAEGGGGGGAMLTGFKFSS